MLKRRDALELCPTWMQPSGSAAGSPRLLDWALWLCNAENRSTLAALLSVIDELGLEDLSLLPSVPPPAEGGDLEAHMRSALRGLLELEHAVRELPAEHSVRVEARLAAGESKAALLQTAGEIETMRSLVNGATFLAIIDRAGAAQSTAERDASVRAYAAAIRFFEQSLGSAGEASIGQLD